MKGETDTTGPEQGKAEGVIGCGNTSEAVKGVNP